MSVLRQQIAYTQLFDNAESYFIIVNRPAKRLYDSSEEDETDSEGDTESRPSTYKMATPATTPKQTPAGGVFSPLPRLTTQALRESFTPLQVRGQSETPTRGQNIGPSK